MSSFGKFILFVSVLISAILSFKTDAGTALDAAFSRARLSKTKPLDENIRLALNYIQNQKNQSDLDVDELEKHIKDRNIEAIQKKFGSSIPSEFYKDDISALYGTLDMKRTAEQAMDRNGDIIAYGCRTAALVFAELMVKSGVDPRSVHVVETVEAQDLQTLCPKKSQEANSKNSLSLGGHVYVLIQMPNKEWRLFNPLKLYDSVYNGEGKGYRFSSPSEIETSITPMMIPHEMNAYLKEQGDLAIFSTKSIREVPYYKLDQRKNVVASGNTSSSVCKKAMPSGNLVRSTTTAAPATP